MRPAWFAGASAHTALGATLKKSIDGLGTLREPDRVPLQYADVRGEIPYMLLADAPLTDPERRLYSVLDRVIDDAFEAAGCDRGMRSTTGLFIGSSSMDISVSEAKFMRDVVCSDDAVALDRHGSIANLARHVKTSFGLNGPAFSFNTACTASANALMAANDMIAAGRLERALVVGVELFNVVTATGFQGLELFSTDLMRPFDRERQGLNLGEGCSAVVLAAQPRSGGEFQLRGAFNRCDTYAISATNPDGATVAATIEGALAAAGMKPADIDAVKVHGTASLSNDEAEAAGMLQTFPEMPPVCALKPYTGHTLGACGLNELLLFCGAAERGFLPGTPGVACEATADLGLILTQGADTLAPGNFLLNFFGFGGNNTSLVVSNALH